MAVDRFIQRLLDKHPTNNVRVIIDGHGMETHLKEPHYVGLIDGADNRNPVYSHTRDGLDTVSATIMQEPINDYPELRANSHLQYTRHIQGDEDTLVSVTEALRPGDVKPVYTKEQVTTHASHGSIDTLRTGITAVGLQQSPRTAVENRYSIGFSDQTIYRALSLLDRAGYQFSNRTDELSEPDIT